MSTTHQPEPVATAVVTHRVKPGCRDTFLEAQRNLMGKLREFPGYRYADIIPPTSGDGKWVVLFRFDTLSQLQGWLNHPDRPALLATINDLIEEPSHLHILAQDPSREGVSVVFAKRIKPEFHRKFRQLRRRLWSAQEENPGFLGNQSFDPVPGVQEEFLDISRYESQDALDQWLTSPTREALLRELEPMLEEPLDLTPVPNSLQSWFAWAPPGRPPAPRWKQALTVLSILFPITLIVQVVVRFLEPGWPAPWILLPSQIATVAFSTWLALPFAHRLLAFWLHPKNHHITSPTRIATTSGLLLALPLYAWLFSHLLT